MATRHKVSGYIANKLSGYSDECKLPNNLAAYSNAIMRDEDYTIIDEIRSKLNVLADMTELHILRVISAMRSGRQSNNARAQPNEMNLRLNVVSTRKHSTTANRYIVYAEINTKRIAQNRRR
jgi:hypothetical protein